MSAVSLSSSHRSTGDVQCILPRSRLISNVTKLALSVFTIYAIASVPTASAGIFSGLITLGGCVGAGILFPASLFWTAAPCYELTILATANPLLP